MPQTLLFALLIRERPLPLCYNKYASRLFCVQSLQKYFVWWVVPAPIITNGTYCLLFVCGTSTVKLGNKEWFDKEQIGIRNHFL